MRERISVAIAFIVVVQAALSLTLPLQATGLDFNEGPDSPPPAETSLNATTQIDYLIRQADEGLMEKYIQKLQDFKTRFSYRGDRCYPASEYIASVFSQNGLNVTFDEFTYQYYKMRNVIGEKKGVTNPDIVFIISSHYDSIANYWAWTEAPGADDNGSGTAAVMALAEILSDYEFNCTIRFICFSGEEQGLKGSGHYASSMVVAGENISAVLNMDMIANNPDPGSHTVRLFTGGGTIMDPTTLINEVINTTSIHADPIGLSILQAGAAANSDHHPFANYYRSIMLIESVFSAYYHSTADTIDKLNFTYCANVTQIIGATVARMAGIQQADTSPPSLSPGSPSNGTYSRAMPVISIEVTDPGGLNASSFILLVDGTGVVPSLTQISLGYNVSFIPPADFPDGKSVNVSFSGADISGNLANTTWSFTVDAIPPEPPTELMASAAQIQPAKQGLAIDTDTAPDSRYAHRPSVIFHDGEYKMWYSAYDSSKYRVCYANSSDGITWSKHGIVLSNGTLTDYDSVHAGHPSAIFDGEYKMWYSGFSNSKWRILYANSSDGITWSKQGLALVVGAPGEMDDTFAQFPCVLKTDEYKMWYTGLDGLRMHILYANSSDGINWVKSAEEVTFRGPGIVHGDALVSDPAVVFNGTHYLMYYGRYDGLRMRTMLATSEDCLHWTEMGMAIDIDMASGYESYRAYQCCVLLKDNETKIWYTAYNNVYQRIMYANLTGDGDGRDTLLTWSPSSSQDVISYDVFRESRPSAFQSTEAVSPEYYNPPVGLTRWPHQRETVHNISVYGPATGFGQAAFVLPDDNLLDLTLYLKQASGSWERLTYGSDYSADLPLGLAEGLSYDPGCEFFACYNHSATKALRLSGSTMVDSGAGTGSNVSYYYIVRARDRAGNVAYCSGIAGKMGQIVSAGWNLICNPFLAGPKLVEDELQSLEWDAARTWDPAKPQNHWTLNIPGREPAMNSLQTVDSSDGIWVRSTGAGIYTAFGRVANVTIHLSAGWNLVCFPHHEFMPASDALAGIPWDSLAIYSPSSSTLLENGDGATQLWAGLGFWVHVTSDAEWNAVNVP